LLDPCFDQREALVDPPGVRQGFRELALVEAPAQKSQAGVEVAAPLYEIRVMPTPKISDVHLSKNVEGVLAKNIGVFIIGKRCKKPFLKEFCQ
jgi:hypothetical protein